MIYCLARKGKHMTFDDGILTIYKTDNIAKPGDKPVIGLVEKDSYYFRVDTLGITRYYTAMQAGQQVEMVVDIPDWNDIQAIDICVLEDEIQYKMAMIQRTYDEDGLKIMKLTLERMNEKYAVKG